MTAEPTAQTETAAEAVQEISEAAAGTVRKAAVEGARRTKKVARKARRTTKRAAAKTQARAQKRNESMTFEPKNMFAGFSAFPAVPGFDTLFANAAERGEDVAKRSRKAAEELAEMYRGNVDAFVEAGRIAASGAQSIGQKITAKSRDSVEETANKVRSLVEAKSPTELLQLQSDYARGAFDRFVEESSNLTESFVKLASEAFQPISNRASANVEKLNKISA